MAKTEPLGLQRRTALRERPPGTPVMYQKWRDLLFLHWRWDPADIARRLPPGLQVDSFDGSAWMGLVPLFIRDLRPRALPALPFLSHFMELNLRTYVYDPSGTPGVWFFSLDAANTPAVLFARRILKLPYFSARMRHRRDSEGFLQFHSRRRRQETDCEYHYRPATTPLPAEPGSLEFFLIERYILFSFDGSSLWRAQVHHAPYPLAQVEVPAWDENLFALDGFTPPATPFGHATYSRGVDMCLFPPKKVR